MDIFSLGSTVCDTVTRHEPSCRTPAGAYLGIAICCGAVALTALTMMQLHICSLKKRVNDMEEGVFSLIKKLYSYVDTQVTSLETEFPEENSNQRMQLVLDAFSILRPKIGREDAISELKAKKVENITAQS